MNNFEGFAGLRRIGRGAGMVAIGAALLLPGMYSLRGMPALAQRGQVQRVVEGTVQSKEGAIVKGAVVYLQDNKSLAVKSFVSTDAGTFHFGQLSPDTDYDIWAEIEGKRSKNRTISQFDSKKLFTFTLKIDM